MGVTCWTSAGGAGEMTSAGAAGGVPPPSAGTGVNGSGVSVAVGVLPLRVELTIWRVGAAAGVGVAVGALDCKAPVPIRSAAPTPAATRTAMAGTTMRCQGGGGLWSVTRQARGLAGLRLAGARVGTAER
jgi:hypothetical protein